MRSLLSAVVLAVALPSIQAGFSPKARAADDSGNTVEMVATTWYAGWHSEDFPLSRLSWDKYTEVTYAFAVTTPDVTQLSLEGSNEALLPEFVSTAHQHGVKASVSVGGWTGSQYFSTNVASAENRTAFVKAVTDLAQRFQLDGIDFDWEYPNRPGIGCNIINPDDTSNFLSFLQELRADPVGKNLTLSAAVSVFPFAGPDGNPSADVSGFAEVFDYIAIMNYDIWGGWSTAVGPNAPLNDTCASSENQQGSAVSAVAAWAAAGMPRSQIVLAVPAYGHSFNVNSSSAFTPDSFGSEMAAYPAFNADSQPKGDSWDEEAGVDVCGNTQGYGGSFNYWGMIEEGFLTASGEPAPGIASRFDECSQTPFVYNETSQVMISYDNARSFAAKGEFIRDHNLRGFAIWEAAGDYEDTLLNSIRTAVGLNDDNDDEVCP